MTADPYATDTEGRSLYVVETRHIGSGARTHRLVHAESLKDAKHWHGYTDDPHKRLSVRRARLSDL